MTQSYLKSFFLKSKNFQKTYIEKLPTLLYTYEQEFNDGDTLFLSLNPDNFSAYEQFNEEKNFITPSKASEIFDQITETSLKYPLKKQFLKSLKKSYLESFLELKDYEGDKQPHNDLRVKYKGIRKSMTQDKIAKDKQKKKKYERLDENKNKQQAYDQQERNLLEDKQKDFHIQNIKQKGQTIQGKNNQHTDLEVHIEKDIKEENKGFIPQPHPLSKENKIKKKQQILPKIQIKKKKKTQKQQQDEEEDMSIKKIIVGGGFMKYNEQYKIWEKTEIATTDFLTLLRQTIYILLAYQGIIVREFVTSDGQFMAAVCYAYEKNLKFMGQQKAFMKQCDLSMIDMLSLEPVDNKYRPLRFNAAILKEEKWKDQLWYINSLNKGENDQLRQDILDLLDDVKIHTLPRKCNALNDKSYFYDKEKEDIIQQHQQISQHTWIQYKKYLENLKNLLHNIDQQYLQRKQQLHQYFFKIKFKEEEKKISVDSQRLIQKEQLESEKSKLKISKKLIKDTDDQDYIVPKQKIKQKVTYVVYKKFIKHNQSQFRIYNNKLKKKLGNAYVKALLKSYRKIDQDNQILDLKNIWMHLNIKPLEPYIKFYLPSNKRRPRIKDFFDNLYKDFTSSTLQQNQFFSSVEKISIIDWQVNNSIDMGEVSKIQKRFLRKLVKPKNEILTILNDVFFPLHNYYQLLGHDNSQQFKELLQLKKQKAEKQLQNHIQQKTKIQKNKNLDIDKDYYLPKQQQLLKLFKQKIRAKFPKEIQIESQKQVQEENINKKDIIKQDVKNASKKYKKNRKDKMKLRKFVWPIEKIFQIGLPNFFFPWLIQSKILINYFGEKLAMYFQFTIYFAITILPVLIIGLICWAVNFVVFFFDNNSDQQSENQSSNQSLNVQWYQVLGTGFNWILGISSIIWSCFFYYEWQNQETIFRIENGLSDELVLKERMDFKNFKHERSLINDFINNKETNQLKINIKLIVSICITILLLSLSFTISISFFYLKNYFVDTLFKDKPDDSLVNYKHNLVNALETIKIILFDHFFYYIAVKLVEWIDPKYTHEFESMLIGLITFFGVLNNYFMIFYIILFKEQFMNCAETQIKSSYKTKCLIEAELLFRTYVVFNFLYSVLRIFFSYFRIKKIQNKNKKINKSGKKWSTVQSERQVFNKLQNNTNMTFQNQSQMSQNIDQMQDELIYNEINKNIEQQIYLQISNSNDDYDTTLVHYYQIFNQFAGLVLLSLLFSLSYLFVFFSIMIELILDRKLYFKMMRRISPLSSSTIGNWKISLQIVSLLGILTNGYTLTFEYSSWYLDEDHSQARIFMLIIFFVLGTLIWLSGKFYKSIMPLKYRIMEERQNFIKQTIRNNQREKNQENETAKVQLNIQSWGQIDYEYFEKMKERKRKKILKINQIILNIISCYLHQFIILQS